MKRQKIGAVVLAAGYASRMGRCKALLEIGVVTAPEGAVRRLRAGGVTETVVVTGSYRGEVEAAAAALGCVTAYNDQFHRGMYSSVLTGVKSLPADVEAFLLLPVDIPLVRETTVRALIESGETGPDVVYPAFLGKKGHPPLISRRLVPEILNFGGDGGLRALLARHDRASLVLDVPDEGIVMDMDTPEDYGKLRDYAARAALPSAREVEALLEMVGTPPGVRDHCRAVAGTALKVAEALEKKVKLDARLPERAALLHDISRTEPDHAARGAEVLERWGYPRVAGLVRQHMELEAGTPMISEAAILYLADKLTGGKSLHTLEEREAQAREKFAGDPGALEGMRRRLGKAREIQAEVERLTGREIGAILA
jgi:putative nucleotidyltransferase with HDIG domain